VAVAVRAHMKRYNDDRSNSVTVGRQRTLLSKYLLAGCDTSLMTRGDRMQLETHFRTVRHRPDRELRRIRKIEFSRLLNTRKQIGSP